MKTSRTTYILIGLFFGGLLLLWGLERAGVLTESQRLRRHDRILPALMDLKEADVRKVEIVRNGETLTFERRGRHGWQMSGALNASADANDVESLIQNLRALQRSPDAGVLDGPDESFGLAPAEATIRLWTAGAQEGSPSAEPIVSLEVGKATDSHRYVKARGAGGIDVVDPKILAVVDRTAADWRDKMLAPLPTFQVSGLTVERPGLKIKADRGAGGQWILTEPVHMPADGSKIEAALASLAGLRVAPPSGSFAADDVTDFTPFGLDAPQATIELRSPAEPSNPTVLMIGKSPADQPGRVYVRRGDQDDVALVDAHFLGEIPTDSLGFRGQNVAQLIPQAAYRVEIKAPNGPFELIRKPSGWELISPRPGKADMFLVDALLGEIDALQTSEYLEPSQVADAGLDPPIMTVRVWQMEIDGSKKNTSSADAPPAVELLLGRHDAFRKTIYGRLPGDSYILALPDTFLEVLPKNSYAFRDRALPGVRPELVTKLTLVRDGRTTVLEPDPNDPNQWRMTAPVKAKANVPAVTALLVGLSNLRADDFAADSPGDGAAFGLDAPVIELSWEVKADEGGSGGPGTGSLKVSKAVRGKPSSFYATLSDYPPVFTLDAAVLRPLTAEFHDTVVQKYPHLDVRRLVLLWPSRALGFTRTSRPTGKPTDWTPDPGTSIAGIDMSLFDKLVEQLSELHAVRFTQYEGPIPTSTGLAEPRLAIEVGFGSERPPSVVRIGASTGDGHVLATVGDGLTGSVFLLPDTAWEAMIAADAGKPAPTLPEDVFAPPAAP